MTCSVVAVITDVIRDGARVVGFGFNSNGRYGQGALMRERFLPRLLEADPATLIDAQHDNLDPLAIWNTLMTNEKPGGHGERSVAVGTIDMAVWDAIAKIARQPLYRLIADRYRNGKADEKVWVYAAGGYYYPGKGYAQLQDEMRSYRDRGYKVVKMKIGGATLDEDIRRIEAVLQIVGEGQNLAVDANGRFDLPTALNYARALKPYNLFWYEEAGDPLDYALQAQVAERYALPMARTCFLIRTRATCCVTAACAPIATICNSIAPFPTGWSNTCARWRCSGRMAGRRGAWCRTVATRCRSTSRRVCSWAAMSPIRMSSGPSAASPMASPSKTAT
jgi:L-alanine-DL-glutamate epimerase-like enolase superfamily enzyme